MNPYIIPFEKLKNRDVDLVGGKNASIGEMISGLASLGVSVPGGFATTSHAYRDFLAQGGLDERIRAALASLDVDDVERLAVVGRQIRGWMLATPFPGRLQDEVLEAWRKMGGGEEFAVAVRSSATAEDLPEASFAGQQETFLNVRGEEHLLELHARGLCLSFQRPRNCLSRAQQFRSQRRGPVGRRAAHGAQRSGRRRRHVHARYGLGLSRGGIRHLLVRSRRDRRAGRGQSGRVLRLQARASRRPPFGAAQESRAEGDQDDIRRARRTGTGAHRRRGARGPPAIFARRGGRRVTGEAGPDHRGALRHADGYRMGQGRRHRQAVHLAGAAGNGAEPRRPRRSSASRSSPAPPCWSAGAASASASAPVMRASSETSRKCPACGRATCWSPT